MIPVSSKSHHEGPASNISRPGSKRRGDDEAMRIILAVKWQHGEDTQICDQTKEGNFRLDNEQFDMPYVSLNMHHKNTKIELAGSTLL